MRSASLRRVGGKERFSMGSCFGNITSIPYLLMAWYLPSMATNAYVRPCRSSASLHGTVLLDGFEILSYPFYRRTVVAVARRVACGDEREREVHSVLFVVVVVVVAQIGFYEKISIDGEER